MGSPAIPNAMSLGLVRRHPVWAKAADVTVRAMLKHGVLRDVTAGADVLKLGETATHVTLVLRGAVRVFYPATAQRGELTVKLFGAPSTFGEAECVLRGAWNESVQTLVPSTLLSVDAGRYFGLLQDEPSACFHAYWEVARQFGVAIQWENTTSAVTERVIAIIVAYASHFGRTDRDSVLIDHALSQDELARQSGSTRRTIVRVMADLYASKLVTRAGRKLRIPSVDALLAHAALPNIAMKADPKPWAV